MSKAATKRTARWLVEKRDGRHEPLRWKKRAALRVKDAIADRFRSRTGARPSVDTTQPDLRIHVHLRGCEARLALDLGGESLHRRGYRTEAGPAPLRETLAAALLVFADWPAIASAGGALLDPMCGSGTLLAEAALIATG